MSYPIFGQCPVCHQPLEATRLHCRHCDTAVEGRFDLGPLYRLSPEQIDFVILLVRCEGKLNRMQEELGVSYPTVRSRLSDVIQALGFTIDETSALTDEERQAILQKVADGELSSKEAIKLIKTS